MKQVLVRGGRAVVEEVPVPLVGTRSILVRVAYSCVSAGTETAMLRMSALPLYRRALAQRDKAKRVLDVGRDQGLIRTYKRVRDQLSAGLSIGYSAAGTVIEAGADVTGFAPGDRVACAGAGVANHAEVIDVPVNLAVTVSDDVSLADASTVALGAIALQGVRRANPTLGETVGVIGLGILGQLTAQLLSANGCRVVGSDLEPQRVELALRSGMAVGVLPGEDFVDRARALTDGYGADAVIITAATPSHDIVRQAMQACRRKARVVLVGDVGLHLERADLYEKELDFLMSTSYGPGRYDDVYETEGHDYPLPFVRWTENRNMDEYVRLLAEGAVSIANLGRQTYEVDEAPAAYEALNESGEKPLLVQLSYPVSHGGVEPRERIARLRRARPASGRIRVALVGAGAFAQGTHIPNLLKLANSYEIHCVVSRTGKNATAVASRTEASYATTDYEQVLADDDVDLVLIATRHDLHGRLTRQALDAGKSVFVEKPLALTEKELARIGSFYENRDTPLLMTGFNRRFSPAAVRANDFVSRRKTPLIVDYQMNAGYIPPDHWVQGPEGGGRNIGEACHIYDLFDFLTDAEIASVHAQAIRPSSPKWLPTDNFVATLAYRDGSVCTLTYTALGHRDHPKEHAEIFVDGDVVSVEDYKLLRKAGRRGPLWRSRAQQKGHRQQLEVLAVALREGGPWPIALDDQLRAMEVAFRVQKQISPA